MADMEATPSGGWTCEVCTFLNTKLSARKCEICRTKRSQAAALVGKTKKTTAKQTTLFGTVLEKDKQAMKQERTNGVVDTKIKSAKAALSKTVTASSDATASSCGSSDSTTHGSARITQAATRKRPHSNDDDKPSHNNKKTPPAMESSQHHAHNLCLPTVTPSATTPVPELKQRIKVALRDIFRIAKLRPMQKQAISTTVLKRQSQLLILATGGGKSLTYQLPAVILGGTTIVISPLIALMNDQVHHLQVRCRVPSAVLSSAQSAKQNRELWQRLESGTPSLSLLYVTPEQVKTDRFREWLNQLYQQNRLCAFAIDEAHCVSTWGADFRRSYLQLDYLQQTFPSVPLLACTATASQRVIEDMQRILRLEKCPVHKGSFDRPNIFYKVRYKDYLNSIEPNGAIVDMVSFINKQHERYKAQNVDFSGIVYVHTRADTDSLSRYLSQHCGLTAAAYHAGLKAKERTRVQQDWTAGKIKLCVATVAFGMGIDLAHVRFVIHWNLAKSVESFYQESGRAGRDGLPAHSLLYFSKSDEEKFRYLLSMRDNPYKEMKSLDTMVNYCISKGCRRAKLLKHFDEENPNVCEKTCDWCSNPSKTERSIDGAAGTSQSCKTSWQNMNFDPIESNPLGCSLSEEAGFDWDSFDKPPDQVGGLNITGGGSVAEVGGPSKNSSKGFVKASSILSKYEKYEAIENEQASGFVNFRPKTSQRDRLRVPKHLVPDSATKKAAPTTATKQSEPTSKDYASEADRLRAELAQAKAALQEKQNAAIKGRKT